MKKFIAILLLSTTVLATQDLKACICSEVLTTDSLAQLKNYDFIAYIKVTGDRDYKDPSGQTAYNIGLISIKIIELFKGKDAEEVLDYTRNTSCDIGISTGEEWVLFGRIKNGKITLGACDRSRQYKDAAGKRDWTSQRGVHELRQLRVIFQHPVKSFGNGVHREYYANGQLEIEETYSNGQLHGPRKIWHPNGMLFSRETYIHDTLNGKSEWFYPSGQTSRETYHAKGRPCNVSRFYYDSAIYSQSKPILLLRYKTEDSLRFAYNRIQVAYETVYDAYGRLLIARGYTRLGKISHESIIDPDRGLTMQTHYHDNGTLSSIGYTLNGKNYGHYQTYTANGFPGKGWDYDENGVQIKL